MPTVAQVLSTEHSPAVPARWYAGTVTAVNGGLITAALDNTEATLTVNAVGTAPPVGAAVLLIICPAGAYCFGPILGA